MRLNTAVTNFFSFTVTFFHELGIGVVVRVPLGKSATLAMCLSSSPNSDSSSVLICTQGGGKWWLKYHTGQTGVNSDIRNTVTN